MYEQLQQLTEVLRLYGMSQSLAPTLINAEKNGLAIQDVLLELLQDEYQNRQERQLDSRLKLAKLPWDWTLDSFPFKSQPGVNKTQIMGLSKLDFVERRENTIFIGKPGTGKTGLATSLLRLALINGYRGRFYNAQNMLDELYASLADRTTPRLLKRLCNYDVLLIDELGYLTLNDEQINAFFKLIDMRYRKKTTIITTNLDYPAWYDVFKQKDLVDAMLDRFRHYCTTIHIKGPSLRTPMESDNTQTSLESSDKNKLQNKTDQNSLPC